MKKLYALLLAGVMVFSLTACGGGEETAEQAAPQAVQQTASDENNNDRFVEFGLSLEKVLPEGYTSFEVADDDDRRYRVEFTMPDTVTDDFGFAYYKAIYDLTAGISEGGTNYKQTGGSAISPEVSPMGAWEDEHSTEAHMNVWFYKYNGKLLHVQIIGGIGYDNVISFTISDFS